MQINSDKNNAGRNGVNSHIKAAEESASKVSISTLS
ncbi:uncharacterized protein METZ01_LOCUS225718 [marine metagenome]|uniref:Uncharacterized protein n=1 Tax=marine metagenome TaxID=408172 RepID=A0A382GDU6_9ZZZZ